MPTYKDLTHTSSQVDQTIDQFAAHAANAVIHVTEAEKESWNSKADADASYTKAEANALLFDKVDKVAGKQLSTEDFTAADKAKLQSLNNYDDTEVRGLISENADDIESEVSNRTAADAELNSAIGVVANSGAKNIVNNTADDSRTISGVLWTKNADGSMTATNTSTGVSAVRVVGVQGSSTYASAVPIPRGTYTVSASGFAATKFRFALGFFSDANATREVTNVYNEPYTLTVNSDTARYDLSCVIALSGEAMDGETWYPMIRRAEIKDDTFAPYAPSNRELYEMILALQNGGASLQSLQPTLMSGASTNDEEAKEV